LDGMDFSVNNSFTSFSSKGCLDIGANWFDIFLCIFLEFWRYGWYGWHG
jgi:hypothetical protein